jgi:hypothetical protein
MASHFQPAPRLALSALDHDAWAAALHAARILRESNASDAEDRARFRVARNRLVALLPVDADVSDIIGQAVHWYAMNDVAAQFAGMEMEAGR